jgi:hypothetical protein
MNKKQERFTEKIKDARSHGKAIPPPHFALIHSSVISSILSAHPLSSSALAAISSL